jgi:hypothetical protein
MGSIYVYKYEMSVSLLTSVTLVTFSI